MIKIFYSYIRLWIIVGMKTQSRISLWKYCILTMSNKFGDASKIHKLKAPTFKNFIYLRNSSADFSVYRDFFIKNDYVKTLPNAKIIIDAGSHIGCSVLKFNYLYPKAIIISIEANKDNYDFLCKNIEGIDEIKTQFAAVDNTTDIKMTQNQQKNDINSSYSYSFSPSQDEKSNLKSVSINSILKTNRFQIIDIVKLDVEGGEVDVFADNTEWIDRTKQIIVELHDYKRNGCSKSLIKQLNTRNFAIEFSGENLLLTNLDLVNNYFPNATK